MVLPRIYVTTTVLNALEKIFNCSRAGVYLALKYHRNSNQAKAIRAKAIELKEAELQKEKSYERKARIDL